MRRLALALITLLLAIGCDDGGGNTNSDTSNATAGAVAGTVSLSDGGDPAGVEVTLDDASLTVASDGAYRFDDILPGGYALGATLEGYQAFSVNVTVDAGVDTLVDITLSPQTTGNQQPVISAFTVRPSPMPRAGTAEASVTATDPEGDTLTYTFNATGGFTVTPDANDPAKATVTAPDEAGASGTLEVTVDDGQGGTATDSTPLSTPDVGGNTAPRIDSFTANPNTNIDPEAVIALQVTAVDSDGDPLTYTWEVDLPSWTLIPNESSAVLTAANALGSVVIVTVTVEDGQGGVDSDTLTLTTTPCPSGQIDCDMDASNGCEDVRSGKGALCANTTCRVILSDGLAEGDGLYWVAPDGDLNNPFEVYCDMTTDGGGWMLMGTISGADADNWNVETGIWADTSTLGGLSDPFSADFKSPAWSEAETRHSEVLYRRTYDGQTRAEVVLDSPCVRGAENFNDLFTTYDTSRACTPADIRVLNSDPTGLASAAFQEGAGAQGLGNAATNGMCWFSEDLVPTNNAFKGHFGWHDDSTVDDCNAGLHSGGLAVFESDSNFGLANNDFTATSWLVGVDTSLMSVSFFTREFIGLEGELTTASPGQWADGSHATSCKEYRYPSNPLYRYSGATTGDGIYRIDPDGQAPGSLFPIDVFCDMTSDGGGWTAVAANGDNSVGETVDPADCYPLVSGDTAYAGCGAITDLMNDFSVPGEYQAAISWRYMMGIAYGDTGYDEKLGYFGIDYGAEAPTAEERNGGSRYRLNSLGTRPAGTEIRCTAETTFIVHYCKACTYNNRPTDPACGKGTIFGHDRAADMSLTTRRTLGFTDANTTSVGLDDYQDGWSCGDNWQPQSARGARMTVLVR